MHFLFLLFVPAVVYGFDSSFNYGCQNGKCTFQLVVPKEVAQYIDENALSSEVGTISSSLTKLTNTITNFSDAGAENFTTAFNAAYTPVSQQAQALNSSTNVAVQNATDLVTSSNSSATLSQSLYNSIACFQGNANSSYTCFTPPTTAAPPTTQAALTTVTGGVTGGSTDVPVSTVPFTGSTEVPVTGGSTAAPGSTNAPASDSSSPSTSAGSSGTTPTGSASSTSADVSSTTDSSSSSVSVK